MGKGSARALALALAVILACSDVAVVTAQETERIEGSAGDVLEDDPVGGSRSMSMISPANTTRSCSRRILGA